MRHALLNCAEPTIDHSLPFARSAWISWSIGIWAAFFGVVPATALVVVGFLLYARLIKAIPGAPHGGGIIRWGVQILLVLIVLSLLFIVPWAVIRIYRLYRKWLIHRIPFLK